MPKSSIASGMPASPSISRISAVSSGLPIAAEAARPYAQRMETVLGNLAASMMNNPGAPKLLSGTGKEDVQLLIVATSERGLCGGFNTQIVRLARPVLGNSC